MTAPRLPYVFEPGMRVTWVDGAGSCLVVRVDPDDIQRPLKVMTDHDSTTWLDREELSGVIADIDHPGTRGLLLEQYRRASGHALAYAAFYEDADEDGPWAVCPGLPGTDGFGSGVGQGESEGAAILDALTRLAAERETITVGPVSIEDRIAIIETRLTELERRSQP